MLDNFTDVHRLHRLLLSALRIAYRVDVVNGSIFFLLNFAHCEAILGRLFGHFDLLFFGGRLLTVGAGWRLSRSRGDGNGSTRSLLD